MSWFGKEEQPLGYMNETGSVTFRLTASEARIKSEENAAKQQVERRAKLMKTIEDYYVNYGHTEAHFNSNKSKYCQYGQNLHDKDVSFLESLGYKVEFVTEPYEYFNHHAPASGPIKTETSYYIVSW